VQERGADYVDRNADTYEACEYAYNGEPGCIVGHVFSYVGIDPTKVREGGVFEVIDLEYGVQAKHAEIIPDSPAFSDGARSVLAAAQHAQDSGRTWGEALDTAKKEAW